MTETGASLDLEFQNNELINQIKYNNEKEFWITEYRCIISQFTKYVGLYFLVFVVYLGIQGFLLIGIYGLPNDIFPNDIKELLIFFTKVCCYLFFFCTFVALAIVNKLSKRKKKALFKLGFDEYEVEDEFSIGVATTFVYIVFNSILLYILYHLA